MIPSQTLEVLLGIIVTLLYAAAATATGSMSFAALIGRQAIASICSRVGQSGFIWLAFVMGQGILGTVWLSVALGGVLHSWIVWAVVASGCATASKMLFLNWSQITRTARVIWPHPLSPLQGRSWYLWVGLGISLIVLLGGVTALLPPENDDAIRWYLPVAKAIASSHRVALQPFVTPHSALYPLQVEMHWAALLIISNETAVTVWDYLCSLSFLAGIALLSWSLTRSRRVVLLAVLIMLSTPGFFGLMGSGKVDNAGSQYGIGVFLWLLLWLALRRRAVMLAGLYLGWAVASRYTNVILLPAFILFGVTLIFRPQKEFLVKDGSTQLNCYLLLDVAIGTLVGAFTITPMLIKNWFLVGCPFAPVIGCEDRFWAGVFWSTWNNISVTELFFYPFVWTFLGVPDSYGGISPLFLGFGAFLLAYRRSSIVRSALISGVAGLASLTMWLIIKPLILYTRWLLIPLALFTVPLSAAVVSVDHDHRNNRNIRWLIRIPIFFILFFLLFQCRGAVYGFRYLASIDTRHAKYETKSGYDVAVWLNTHVLQGQRVALNESIISRYFLSSDILWHSESSEELQWLWEHRGMLSPADFWQFHANNAFSYVVIAKNRHKKGVTAWDVWPRVNNVLSDFPNAIAIETAFEGTNDVVLKIKKL